MRRRSSVKADRSQAAALARNLGRVPGRSIPLGTNPHLPPEHAARGRCHVTVAASLPGARCVDRFPRWLACGPYGGVAFGIRFLVRLGFSLLRSTDRRDDPGSVSAQAAFRPALHERVRQSLALWAGTAALFVRDARGP